MWGITKTSNGAHSSCSLTLICTGNTKGLERLEDNTKVVRADGQVSKGLEGVTEGDEATRMLYAHSHPVRLTTKHRKLIRMPARMVSLSTMLPTAMALQPTSLMSMVPCPQLQSQSQLGAFSFISMLVWQGNSSIFDSFISIIKVMVPVYNTSTWEDITSVSGFAALVNGVGALANSFALHFKGPLDLQFLIRLPLWAHTSASTRTITNSAQFHNQPPPNFTFTPNPLSELIRQHDFSASNFSFLKGTTPSAIRFTCSNLFSFNHPKTTSIFESSTITFWVFTCSLTTLGSLPNKVQLLLLQLSFDSYKQCEGTRKLDEHGVGCGE